MSIPRFFLAEGLDALQELLADIASRYALKRINITRDLR